MTRGFFHIINYNFSRIHGSMYFFNINVTFSGHTVFEGNVEEQFNQVAGGLIDE